MATFGSFKFFLSDQRVLRYNLSKFAKGLLLKKDPVTNSNSGVSGGRALNPACGVIVRISASAICSCAQPPIVNLYSLKFSLVSLFASLLHLRFSIIVFCIIAFSEFCAIAFALFAL